MPLYKTPINTNVLFIHIPKVAGTSVEFALEEYYLGFLDRGFSGKYFPCSPQHFHREILSNLFSDDVSDNSFCVVRHPLARFVSEYKFRRRFFDLNENFETWAEETLRKYETNKFMLDNHIRPQSEFPFNSTKVFKLENGLVDLEKHLRDRYKLEVSFSSEKAMKSSDLNINCSKELTLKLEQFYQTDYEAFGY